MRIAIVLVGVCAVAVVVKVANVPRQRAAQPVGNEDEVKVYDLEVDNPVRFLRENLSRVFTPAPTRLFGDDAADGTALVRLRRGDRIMQMNVELISGVQTDTNKYYIALLGSPMGLDECYSLTRRLCDVSGMHDDRILRWFSEKKYNDPIKRPSPLQVGDVNGHRIEIQIRDSFEDEEPWRVVYTLCFSVDDEEKPDRL